MVISQQSLHIYSGGLVQSLNDSKNFPSVVVNAHGEKLRKLILVTSFFSTLMQYLFCFPGAFKVRSSKLESRAMGGAFIVPGLKPFAQTSICCEDHDEDQSVCQLAVQSASEYTLMPIFKIILFCLKKQPGFITKPGHR